VPITESVFAGHPRRKKPRARSASPSTTFLGVGRSHRHIDVRQLELSLVDEVAEATVPQIYLRHMLSPASSIGAPIARMPPHRPSARVGSADAQLDHEVGHAARWRCNHKVRSLNQRGALLGQSGRISSGGQSGRISSGGQSGRISSGGSAANTDPRPQVLRRRSTTCGMVAQRVGDLKMPPSLDPR
jgi:uncharacterized membrane protein YgcG